MVLLDLVVFHMMTQAQSASPLSVISSNQQLSSAQTATTGLQLCPQSCLAAIAQATASSQIKPLTGTPSSAPVPSPQQAVARVKEFFIPLGSGSSTSDEWADIPGLQASIETRNYPSIKTVTFEASIRIPTGNEIAYVRLYNKTDGHPVWFSDVSLEGGTGALVTSQAITLDSGNKLYQVQMKTTLKYEAFVDQTRLHITTY
ncbi:hypothetical protein A2Z00_01540 [Candidatus Gottesmanbacteria bacterium RBG_13_45_10]|uniref:Uncharacterized protein n=1 Tax=Candidatus Gottesmanbacteria bacterium RBG_13_45_10 TaxID=1798370 RepID=A0A1F5ZHQ6_9BACT|nr:MAG: hypothetical protein A2Z00_01540 [Candidatus Gottesmanbacteria bacterium RBG_13_45_10]